ncbi:MAG: hypothetical protein KY469_16075 [Actinobacteria bacterium]|nr:hypothetical protein [Actinomycetota bacterium]
MASPSGTAPSWSIGRALGLIGAGLLVAGAFLPWTADGRVALDLGLLSWGEGTGLPTLAVALIALAIVPGIAALIDDHGWPRAASAVAAAVLVVAWLALGPEGEITSGSLVATAAAALLLLGAATAAPPAPPTTEPLARPAPPTTEPLAHPAPPSPQPDSGDIEGPDVAAVQPGVQTEPDDVERDERSWDAEARPGRVEVDEDTLYVRAWGATRADCIAQAVRGALSLFATVPEGELVTVQPIDLETTVDDELLARLVRRALRALDLTGMGVSELSLSDRFDGGLSGQMGFIPATLTRSPVPTDVPTEDVVLGRIGAAWRAELRFRG